MTILFLTWNSHTWKMVFILRWGPDRFLTEGRPPMSQDPRVSIHTCPALLIWLHHHLFSPLTQTSLLNTTRNKNHLQLFIMIPFNGIFWFHYPTSHLPLHPYQFFYACIRVGLMLGLSAWFEPSVNLSWHVWVGVGGFSKVVATFVHVTVSFNLFMATIGDVLSNPIFSNLGLCAACCAHIMCLHEL